MVKKGIDRVSVGVMNPYAIVASKKGRKFNWEKLTVAEKKDLLEKELKFKYHKLFDPKHGSPLFSRVRNTRGKTKTLSIDTGECAPRMVREIKSWKTPAGSSFSSPNPPPSLHDANQGCSLNCWFVAALASVAWTWPDLIAKTLVCSIKLYKGAAGTVAPTYMPADGTDYTPVLSRTATLSLDLPFGEGGTGDWIYCRPNTNPAALWSSLYEKVYGNFCQLYNYPYDKPDPVNFPTGNPLIPLVHITGKKYYSELLVNNLVNKGLVPADQAENTRTVFDTTYFASADALFSLIYSKCYHPPVVYPNGIIPPAEPRMTSYPMVAWTYPSETIANAKNRDNPLNTVEKSVKYASDCLVAQHSYSVLGVHYDSNTQTKYIVLRNPWGWAVIGDMGGDPAFRDPNTDPADDAYYTAMAASVAKGYWTATPMPKNTNTCLGATPKELSIDLGMKDGIFALSVDKFRSHFAGFGWVR
jgi:hypothetical protein